MRTAMSILVLFLAVASRASAQWMLSAQRPCQPGTCDCWACGVTPARPQTPLPPGPVGYDVAYRWALATGQPLVVFVGTPRVDVPGAVCIAQDTLPQTVAPAVVVGVPTGDYIDGVWLQGSQTADTIRATINRLLFPATLMDGSACRR